MKRLATMLAAAGAYSLMAGETFTWTGAEDAYWTNANNWAEGSVPGVISNVVEGVFAPDEPTGDVAVFGASARTEIDMSGLYSIGAVILRGADCPHYVFGSAADTIQLVPIEPGGCFSVEGDVPEAPTIRCSFSLQSNVENDKQTPISVTNDSPSALRFNGFGNYIRRPPKGSSWVCTEIRICGRGDIAFDGPCEGRNSTSFKLSSRLTGRYFVNSDFTTFQIVTFSESTTVNIAEGARFRLVTDNSTYMNVAADKTVVFNGPGEFWSRDRHSGARSGCGTVYCSGNARCVFNCPVGSYVSDTSATPGDFNITSGSSNGVILFGNPENRISGALLFANSQTVELPRAENLRDISGVILEGGSATLRFTGDEDGAFCPPIAFTNATTSSSVKVNVVNAGAGELTLASELSSLEADGQVLTLTPTKAPIRFTGSTAGAHPPVLSVVAGQGVVIGEDVTWAEGSVLAFAGGDVRVESATLPTLSVDSEASTLRISAGLAVSAPDVAVTGGTLDIVLEGAGATLTVPGRTMSDPVPAGISVNGVPASFGPTGALIPFVPPIDVEIGARGDVIPDASGSVVGIVSAGTEGDDTLAADATAVETLVQVTETPATVAIGEGRSLTAGRIQLARGGGSLTIGADGDAGTLVAADGGLTLENDEPVSTLAVAAALTTSVPVEKTGPGEVVLAGGMRGAAPLDLQVRQGRMVISNATDLAFGEVGVTNFSASAMPELVLASVKGTLGTGNIRVGGRNSQQAARLVISNCTLTSSVLQGMGQALGTAGGIYAGSAGRGIVEIVGRDTVVSNCVGAGIQLPSSYQSCGAVYLREGEVSIPAKGFNLVGPTGTYGYYEVSGGTLNTYASTYIGGDGNSCQAVFALLGGAMTHADNSFRVGVGSGSASARKMVHFYHKAGTLTSNGMNIRDWGAYLNIHAIYTLDGPDALFKSSAGIQMVFGNGGKGTGVIAYFNLNNGGTVRSNSRTTRNGREPESKAFVSFDGGVYDFTGSTGETGTGLFGGSELDETTRVHRVTLAAKGATIRVAKDKSASLWTPLEAPTEQSVTAVRWNGELENFIGSPTIRIIGDGEGATAYADFDSKRGKVTGVHMTSPGWGYTWAKAVFRYGNTYDGTKNVFTNDCDVGVVWDGGLTKAGEGVLTFCVPNDYSGDTVLEEGSIKLFCDGGIPENSAVLLKGGTLDLNGHPAPKKWAVDAADLPVAYAGEIAFPEGAEFDVRGFAGDRSTTLLKAATVSGALPALKGVDAKDWKLAFRRDGLRLVKLGGTMILVR